MNENQEEPKKTSKKIDMPEHERVELDHVFVNELGQFGKFQVWMMLGISIPIIWTAFGLDYIFTASSIRHRCLIPGCDTQNPELAPQWLLNAIPGSSLSNFDNCNRYVNVTALIDQNGQCPANLFDQDQTVRCDDYVYERTTSIVYDFGLECQEFRRAFVGTMNSIGAMISLPITGFTSDTFGRTVALAINLFFYGLFGTIRAFSINYDMYIAFQIIQTSLGAGAYSAAFVLATEFVGPKYRVTVGVIISTLFATGQAVLGLIAWAIQEWRIYSIVLFAPIMLGVGSYFILYESARWLISKKKYAEARKVLEKVCKVNKKELSESTYKALFKENDDPRVISRDDEPLVRKIFKSRVMLQRLCTTPIWWITNTLIYYGLSINAVSLYGNMYVNYILVAIVEIPGFWTALVLLEKLGRKVTLFGAYFVCSAGVMSFAFIPEGNETIALVLYLISKFSIAIVFTSMYIYTAELFPTRYRHSLLGFSSMLGRIGAIVAPLTPALMVYWSGIPSVIFGTMAFISALLILTSPETLGTKMPDTFEDAENIGKK